MILNMTGGGGANLNFKIVNYATEAALLAAKPSVNTIGVITDVPIPNWFICNEEPSSTEYGTVWITIGTSSKVAFNALKKNCVAIYPIAAKQYIGGIWVNVTAKSYQGGEWVDWVRYIFKEGTGTDSNFINQAYSLYNSDMTKERICCNAPQTSGSDGASGLTEAYDFTDYDQLVFDVLSNNSKFSCGFLNSVLKEFNPTFVDSVTPPVGTRVTVSVNISSVSGNKYIAFKIGDGAAGSAEVYNIYLK